MDLYFISVRLECFPITLDDFNNALNNEESFTKKYSFSFPKSAYGNIENYYKIGKKVYEQAFEDKKNYFWYVPWLIRIKESTEIIGIINFKGPVNNENEVTIGYGIEPKYRNKGYASEIVKEIIQWVREKYIIQRILAITAKDNIKSHKVLKNNKFMKFDEIDGELIWKYEFQE